MHARLRSEPQLATVIPPALPVSCGGRRLAVVRSQIEFIEFVEFVGFVATETLGD